LERESGAGLFEVPLVVGVTSHRNLAPGEIESIRQRIADFFAQLKREFPEMPLVVLSALAEGGDQLAAREALAAGARLIAPLPLLPHTYREDFIDEATRAGFEELRQRSEVLQMPLLPGDSLHDIATHGEARDRHYAQAGVFIASHCHILLALWDGRESNLLGGTAQVVRYALDGVMPGWIERRRSERAVLNRVDESIVYHVACSRIQADGGVLAPEQGLVPLQARWLSQDASRDAGAGMQAEFQRMFAHMREFDLDLRRHREEVLAADGENDGSTIDGLFAAADVLAIHFQKRVLWVIRSIHVLAAATGIAFVAYSDLPADVPLQFYAIYLFIVLFAIGMGVAWLARMRDWHRKYIDYRALAEGLRVQRYWRRAGVTTRSPSAFAHDRFMQKTEVELGWIRNVMRVPSMERIDDAPVATAPLAAVISEWIGAPGSGGQLDYYTRKTEHRSRMQRTTHRLGQVSLWAGFAIILFLAIAQRRIGSDTTGLLLALLAVVGIVAAARESYAYRKGDKELIQQYRYMRGVFADAREKIDHEPTDEGKRKILRSLGEIALAEHSEWALMHRQRPLDNARL
jgi:hypothetical protein